MADPTKILLIHSNPALREALKVALGESLADMQVGSPDEVWGQIEGGRVSLVVAEEKVGVRFLEDLSRRSPATPRAILLNGGDRRLWVEAAAEGHVFTAIPENAPDLAPRLRALVTTSVERPRGLSSCTAQLHALGGVAVLAGPLLHATSDVLTVRVEPGDALEHLLPGCELERVVVRRGAAVLVEALAASVQALRPDAGGGYELEVALGPQRPARPAPEEDVVRDVLLRASLLEEAIRLHQLVMERTDGPAVRAVVQGRVDALADMLLLVDPPSGFGPGACVRFSFDAGGAHYRFVTALSEHETHGTRHVVALLPPEIRGRRRARPRVQLGAGEAVLELTPLLGDQPIRRPAADVELEGVGFAAEPGDLLPVGTRLGALRLVMADGTTLSGSGRVVSRAALGAGSGPRSVRCGVQLDALAPEEQSALAGAILRRTHTGLELASGLSFDALWCFLRDAGFIYAEKEQLLLPSMGEIKDTLTRLLAAPHGPLRTLLFRAGGGVLQGHVSAIRAYRRTWMVQHLATRKGGPGTLAAAKALNAGIMDYLEQLPDADWCRIWFRPKNRWPARTFGRFARLKFDPGRCDLRTYSYFTAPTEGAEIPAPPDLSLQVAQAADWAEIRRSFVARGEMALLSSEDLARAPDLSEVDDVYAELGLTRRREAIVARRDGRLLGFALLEASSAGVNLSDLTSAFRVHPLVPEPAVVTALAARARQHYGALGRALAIGLAESPDEGAWSAAGFAKAKEYSCMTVHRSLWRRYVEFAARLYEYVPERVERPHA